MVIPTIAWHFRLALTTQELPQSKRGEYRTQQIQQRNKTEQRIKYTALGCYSSLQFVSPGAYFLIYFRILFGHK